MFAMVPLSFRRLLIHNISLNFQASFKKVHNRILSTNTFRLTLLSCKYIMFAPYNLSTIFGNTTWLDMRRSKHREQDKETVRLPRFWGYIWWCKRQDMKKCHGWSPYTSRKSQGKRHRVDPILWTSKQNGHSFYPGFLFAVITQHLSVYISYYRYWTRRSNLNGRVVSIKRKGNIQGKTGPSTYCLKGKQMM